MKSRHRQKAKADYSALQWKIYIRIAIITISAILVVVLMRVVTSGQIANRLVVVFQRLFNLRYEDAQRLYLRVIRSNLDYFMYGIMAIFFIVLSRFLLSQFSRYFGEISDGLDVLVSDRGGEIRLSGEMSAMESKLKSIRQTLEQREEEARSAEQRKNDLVMYLAHDIKTPLTSVIGYLSLLDEAPDMPREQKAKYVSITLEKAIRLERLVDEFFEITRYSFQRATLSKESLDLFYMLAQMSDEFYPLLSDKGKEIRLRVPEDLAVYGDPDKLARVFNNVLKNAIAYSPDDSVIDITASVTEGRAAVMFTNDGSIPKDELASIFEKFYRLDSARSTDTGGAGLGLAIAREIVLAHGGRIYADSDGGKTVFTVELDCPG